MKAIIFAFALLLYFGAAGQPAFPKTEIDALLLPYARDHAPGLSAGILKDGKFIYSKGFGLANLETKIKNSPQTIFSLASIAKQFTAACIWTLIRDKQLSLDDDIRKYLPEFPDHGHTIKIRHMLNHTSGIRNYHALMDLAGFDYDHEFHDNQYILQWPASKNH